MKTPDLSTILEIREARRAEEFDGAQLYGERVDRWRDHRHLNAFITSPPEVAAPEDFAATGPLSGAPVAVKDNICTRGIVTTAGSDMLRQFVPPRDATAVARLKEAGGVVFGKTNLDEFGMGGATETSTFGATRHPVDPDRIAGGSSGGSAAAVAAGICPAALGSDTGGSVRQPASFCGVVGFKPTWSRVSRRGLIAFASSLDQIGWMTHTVDDAAVLFSNLAGPDPLDATCHAEEPPPVDASSQPAVEPADLRVGVPRDWIERCDVDDDIEKGFADWLRLLDDAGATVVDIELPHMEYAVAAYQVIATAEASSNLARYDGARYGHRAGAGDFFEMVTRSRTEAFGREVKRRILLGTYVLSEGYYRDYYDRACRVRRLIIDEYAAALDDVDVVLTPTTPSTAFELGARTEPLDAYAEDVFTVGPSLAGLPAISLPAGCDAEGLPYGLQLVTASFDEPQLFSAARAVEKLGGMRGGTGSR